MAKRKKKTAVGLPTQMEVYFKQPPQLDIERLAQFVNGREPGVAYEIRGEDDLPANAQGLKVDSFSAHQNGMSIAALILSVPTQEQELLRRCSLVDKVKMELLGHKAHALLTLVGGADRRPVERVLFLYKVAAGLCHQGAIGVANVHTGHVLPGGLLRDIFGDGLQASEMTVWESLRDHGEPAELLVRFGMLELAGKRYLATIGFGYCGLCDFVWQYTDQEEAGEVSQMFRSCFTYQMENGPVIQSGHTFGYDENVAFRFNTAPKELAFPFPTQGVLVVTKETTS